MKSSTILSILLTLFTCKEKPDKYETQKEVVTKDYVLEENGGIFTEVFDSTNVDPNRYTKNNTIYKDDIQFTYSFEHITKEGEILYFKEDTSVVERKNQWKFVNINSVDENTIKHVKITVKYGLEPMIQYAPDYNQTLLQYDYITENNDLPFNSISGAIENENNVWIHPPRDRYFRILELNPFPFIKTPYKLGNSWDWWLSIGSQWGDERWKTWEGGIENQYFYEITEKKTIETALGKLECFIIESTAWSELGETKLTAYFNEKYGFIKLNYINIDGSKTNLELIKHFEGKPSKNRLKSK